jgi:lipopolysaccharide/colanic/teichoic acid biosynthesis glycosyltransferase
MSAPAIVDPGFDDTTDGSSIVLASEQPHLVNDRYRQSANRLTVHRAASHAASELSDVNSWVVSPARRCLDIVVAAIALVILLPAILLIMLLVRITSPGPVFFSQRRAGRDREEFTLYKFRSMRVQTSPGPAITVKGDHRVTPIGAFLRQYKLDELPQFWNILKGNMSLVGPRPKLPCHEGLSLPYRPGVTGMATLVFRNEEKMLSVIPNDQLDAFYEFFIKPRKAQLDLEYMRDATIGTDLKLILRTAAACLFGSDNPSFEEAGKLTRFAAECPETSRDL